MNKVEYELRSGVAVLTIRNSPVNALSEEVQYDLREAFGRSLLDHEAKAVVLIGAGETFVAGTGISDLQAMAEGGRTESVLPRLLMEIELATKPVVAAIRGDAFGGGLELAMAAHYRVGSPDARFGQPEVKLGLIPGAGGTQRLPRLAGLEHAIEMCAYGEPVSAQDALAWGVLDYVVDGDLLTGAIALAGGTSPNTLPRTRDRVDKLGTVESASGILVAARQQARRTRRNLMAPAAAIDAIEGALTMPFEEGCVREREIFSRLLTEGQPKPLMHVFFAERAAAQVPGISKELIVPPVRTAAVIGAGTMGRGIAACFANAGIPVRVKESGQELLDSAKSVIQGIYDTAVAKGRLNSDERDVRLERVTFQLGYEGFEEADVIVEAAFENLQVKQSIFSGLSNVIRRDAILATNTSYLNVDEIAAAYVDPSRVIGLHFFSPANIMRLLEIVPGKATDAEVLGGALALAKKLGKLGVVAGNCPGFIGNRILRVCRREAQMLIEEGATPRQVDAALEEFGMAMGPFAVQDLAGIDIAMSSRHVFANQDIGVLQPRVIDELFALGRYGRKTGKGWYSYENGTAAADPAVEDIVGKVRSERGLHRREIGSGEIVDRVLSAMVSEGSQILEQGFALRASDIDIVLISGYGFPAWRGGLMYYAESKGLALNESTQSVSPRGSARAN